MSTFQNSSGAAWLGSGVRLARVSDIARARVHDILLVSSLYDSFIIAEDGELQEVILKEFLDLQVRHTPGITHVSSGAQALALAWDRARYNLVIASAWVGDMSALTLAQRIKEAGLDTPVVVLAYDAREAGRLVERAAGLPVHRVFLWQGDVRIVPAIVKSIEDRWNVAHDTSVLGVQVILVVEDNVRYYSSFLPTMYSELMHHAHSLVPEGLNLSHKLMRLQAQPKILLCGSYEEAWRDFVEYEDYILGIISDIEFRRGGVVAPDAGLELARRVRERQPDVPVMLQSSRPENQELARSVGASFLVKGSPTLLQQLRRFMVESLGFGDFVFRTPDGREVGRARDLRELEEQLARVPPESLAYHGERNHFSNWFKARTEFALAERLRPRKVSDFPTVEHLRLELMRAIQEYRHPRGHGVVVDFDPASYDLETTLCRLGGGSLGGKARGLAFMDLLVSESHLAERFPGIRIAVPPSVVIGSDVFDEFLDRNRLGDIAFSAASDAEIEARFVGAEVPAAAVRDLAALVAAVRHPLAVRSSSLLEDSQYQPFAGIYRTFMLPNDHGRADVRLRQLLTAVKRVYASMFMHAAKEYLAGSPYRLEEEKMSVVLQRIVGRAHATRFYPDFAGVARSHNFYPLPPMTAADGIAAVALGLGETVVEGGACVRFCPRYPRHVVEFSSAADTVNNAQRTFYALELGRLDSVGRFSPAQFDLRAAEEDGTIDRLGSTYSPQNDAVYDGVSRPGIRLVTFAPLLKHGLFPLAELLDAVLGVASEGVNAPVEIEFAVDLPGGPRPPEFALLQLRPLARLRELPEVGLGAVPRDRLICQSSSALGHGTIDDVRDLIVVDAHRFERGRSHDVAREVARFNAELAALRRPYLLVGVGRWGTADPLLGIPVSWDQISGARAIVEAGFRDLRVKPSQGSHFFQNLVAGNIGYLTVNPDAGDGFIDWPWLAAQPTEREGEFVRHLRLPAPAVVTIDGRTHAGVIVKPVAKSV
ncbi:MAG: PEP/pyruvate-binding domain-containing protein [Betaproteobacteria bacterium]